MHLATPSPPITIYVFHICKVFAHGNLKCKCFENWRKLWQHFKCLNINSFVLVCYCSSCCCCSDFWWCCCDGCSWMQFVLSFSVWLEWNLQKKILFLQILTYSSSIIHLKLHLWNIYDLYLISFDEFNPEFRTDWGY